MVRVYASQPLAPLQKASLVAEILASYARVRRELRHKDLRHVLEALRPSATGENGTDANVAFEARRLGQVVPRVLRLLPTDTRCLTQALVLTRMLARREIDSTLVIGVRAAPEFGAHAWVDLEGTALLPAGTGEFTKLSEF